ncbi:MAG TPA: hypothetical protein VHC95_06955 [Opitutales bacterium]|nr:hypothetical protein [Opitutales bacterium]
MKGLSVRQPWATLILRAGKDIENRTWPTRARGWVLLHAFQDAGDFMAMHCLSWCGLAPVEFPKGAILGAMKIDGCVTESKSPWFVGPYGYIIAETRIFAKPIPYTGALGFFNVELSPELGVQIQLANLHNIRWAA